MSAQDKTEQVLRAIHILLSQSEIYDRQTNRVIVDKQEVLGLLQQLNLCIYEMMEERELTQQSRDAAEREFRKKAEEIIQDAGHTAEDVYAGSVLYTDEALRRVGEIMQETADSMKQLCYQMVADLQKEKAIVYRDQSELKSHLEDLRDTNKYLRLIEERNLEIRKEKEKAERAKRRPERRRAGQQPEEAAPEEAADHLEARAASEEEEASHAGTHLEIKVNPEYFEKAGLPVPEDLATEEIAEELVPEQAMETAEEPDQSDAMEAVPVEIRVNLDADYFKWKEENEKEANEKGEEPQPEKRSFFGRKVRE